MNIIPPKKNEKSTTLHFVNGVVHLHDLICDCPKPLEHSIHLILTQEPRLQFTENTKQKLQKCLTTTEKDGPEDGIDGLEPGDLDALFADDMVEDTG